MEHLVFHKGYSADWMPLLTHRLLIRLWGEDPDNPTTFAHFRSEEKLLAFKEDVLPDFEYSDYDHRGKARQVISDGLPQGLRNLVEQERKVDIRSVADQDRVFFATGRAFDRKRDPKRLRDEDQRIASWDWREKPVVDDQRLIGDYAHGLSLRTFTEVLSPNIADAWRLIDSMPEGSTRNMCSDIMTQKILVQPIPIYRPTSNSFRLFEVPAGLQRIKSEVRKALMRGCVEVDAGALHLAIAAAIWGVPELSDILAMPTGSKRFWRILTEHVAGRALSEPELQAWKLPMKQGVYALTYGGGDAKIIERMRDHDEHAVIPDHTEAARRMKELPVIGSLREARTSMLSRIAKENGMRGAYGWVPLRRGRNPLSVLAMASSSYELALMSELYRVGMEYRDHVAILLYQFDGLTLNFRRDDRMRRLILRRMDEQFAARAFEFGIASSLSIEDL